MDMRMPVMDGREATRRIKATDKGKSTRIIALTASSFEEERQQILSIGCDDFLRKPFRDAILFELLRKHLGVEFIYEAEAVAVNLAVLDKARFAALPHELQAQFHKALAGLEIDTINRTIDAIRAVDEALGQALAHLAKQYDYGRMLHLFEGAEPAPIEPK
jgi:CheY-like chemotaxis protein